MSPNVTLGEGGLKSAEKVSHIIWMAPIDAYGLKMQGEGLWDVCQFLAGRVYKGCKLRMRESYKRFVKTWIRLVSWVRILTPKRFVSYRDWRIQAGGLVNPDSGIQTLRIHIVDSFRRPVFERFGLFSRIQRILTNPHESLVLWHKTNPYQSRLADSRIWIHESEP